MNNDANLYERNNSKQRRDAQQCLEDYGKKIKWNKNGATVIDIGCGDGGVTTSILKPFLPNNVKELVGCDISEKMVQFANAHHATDCVSFTVLDITSDLPDHLREKFDHAFSFYTLHWIKHQQMAFSNIYDLLVRGGDCLLLFIGRMPMYEVYRELARIPRWKNWTREVEHIVSPYHDCEVLEFVWQLYVSMALTLLYVAPFSYFFEQPPEDDCVIPPTLKWARSTPVLLDSPSKENLLDGLVFLPENKMMCYSTFYYFNKRDCFKDPTKDIRRMMSTIGFTKMEVKCLEKVFIYSGRETFKNAMTAITPFKIPLEMQEDFWEDYFKVVGNLNLVHYASNDEGDHYNVKLNYNLIVVYGRK